jgi:hypothetical protein
MVHVYCHGTCVRRLADPGALQGTVVALRGVMQTLVRIQAYIVVAIPAVDLAVEAAV